MINTNPIPQMPNYAGDAQYRDWPTPAQQERGVVPLDSLPAAWWNAMFGDTLSAINEAREGLGVIINELDNLITSAGLSVNPTSLTQVFAAVDKIRKTIATSTAGAVTSSSDSGKVAVDSSTGVMSVNGLGNPSELTTTARTIVSAVNELKTQLSEIIPLIGQGIDTCAPKNHASSQTTYGQGNATNYGHVKVSDTYATQVGGASDGVAASQKALYDVYIRRATSGVAFIGTRAQYEQDKMIAEGQPGHIPSGALVIITDEDEYLKGQEVV